MNLDKLEKMLRELDTRPYIRVSEINSAKFFFGLPITDRKFGLVKKLELTEADIIKGDINLSESRLLNMPRLDKFISELLDNFFSDNGIISYDTSLVALMSAETSNFQPLHLHRHALAPHINSSEFSLFISPSSVVQFSYYNYAISQREAIKLKLVDYTDNSRLQHFLSKKDLITINLSNKEFVRFNGQKIAHSGKLTHGIGLFVIFTKCITTTSTPNVISGKLL
jgi:hypothetical protein